MDQGDAFRKAAGRRGAVEELAAMIPGFRGYLQAEHRREADRLHRECLSRYLDEARQKVVALASEWTDEGRLANLELGERVQDLLLRVASRVRNADQGYAGVFATVRWDDAALETLYEIDRCLLGHGKEIERAASALASGQPDDDAKQALQALRKAVQELDTAFGQRKTMITGVV